MHQHSSGRRQVRALGSKANGGGLARPGLTRPELRANYGVGEAARCHCSQLQLQRAQERVNLFLSGRAVPDQTKLGTNTEPFNHRIGVDSIRADREHCKLPPLLPSWPVIHDDVDRHDYFFCIDNNIEDKAETPAIRTMYCRRGGSGLNKASNMRQMHRQISPRTPPHLPTPNTTDWRATGLRAGSSRLGHRLDTDTTRRGLTGRSLRREGGRPLHPRGTAPHEKPLESRRQHHQQPAGHGRVRLADRREGQPPGWPWWMAPAWSQPGPRGAAAGNAVG